MLGDLLRKRPSESDGVDNIIVVDGIPKVEASRLSKLQTVISNFFTSCGPVVRDHFPTDEKGATKGYADLFNASSRHQLSF